jgi:hypothetical protein
MRALGPPPGEARKVPPCPLWPQSSQLKKERVENTDLSSKFQHTLGRDLESTCVQKSETGS